jgi:hypothetical protein
MKGEGERWQSPATNTGTDPLIPEVSMHTPNGSVMVPPRQRWGGATPTVTLARRVRQYPKLRRRRRRQRPHWVSAATPEHEWPCGGENRGGHHQSSSRLVIAAGVQGASINDGTYGSTNPADAVQRRGLRSIVLARTHWWPPGHQPGAAAKQRSGAGRSSGGGVGRRSCKADGEQHG